MGTTIRDYTGTTFRDPCPDSLPTASMLGFEVGSSHSISIEALRSSVEGACGISTCKLSTHNDLLHSAFLWGLGLVGLRVQGV